MYSAEELNIYCSSRFIIQHTCMFLSKPSQAYASPHRTVCKHNAGHHINGDIQRHVHSHGWLRNPFWLDTMTQQHPRSVTHETNRCTFTSHLLRPF